MSKEVVVRMGHQTDFEGNLVSVAGARKLDLMQARFSDQV